MLFVKESPRLAVQPPRPGFYFVMAKENCPTTFKMVRTGHAGPYVPSGSASPFGLWGSLGTRASKEVIEEEL